MWEEWRHDLCYIRAAQMHLGLEKPEAPAVRLAHSCELSPQDGSFANAYARIQKLRDKGVTGAVVAANFLLHRIAPLQRRSRPMWNFLGRLDHTRLQKDFLTAEVLEGWIDRLFFPGVSCLLYTSDAADEEDS